MFGRPDKKTSAFIQELCLKHKMVQINGEGGTRIEPLLMTLVTSNLQKEASVTMAITLALRAFLPECSVLELSIMCSVVARMMSNRSAVMKKQLDIERESWNTEYDAKKFMKDRGISTSQEMIAKIKEEDALK